MKRYVIAIDQGTTSSRAIAFDEGGNIVAKAQREFPQIYPEAGWVEHDPEDIYREARELQERLDQSRREVEEASSSEDQVSVYREDDGQKAEAYQGPSVISYTLEGRKAMNLPVPAYKCMGGGDVSVSVIVNRKGYVIGVKIIESVSSPDQCLRDYALRAASASRFTASQDAPERQAGEIVYRFVAQ